MIYIYIFRRISISYYFLCLRWLAIYIYVCVYSRWFIHQKDGTCREAVSFVMARQIQDIFLFFELRNTMKNVGGGWWFRWRHEISHEERGREHRFDQPPPHGRVVVRCGDDIWKTCDDSEFPICTSISSIFNFGESILSRGEGATCQAHDDISMLMFDISHPQFLLKGHCHPSRVSESLMIPSPLYHFPENEQREREGSDMIRSYSIPVMTCHEILLINHHKSRVYPLVI